MYDQGAAGVNRSRSVSYYRAVPGRSRQRPRACPSDTVSGLSGFIFNGFSLERYFPAAAGTGPEQYPHSYFH